MLRGIDITSLIEGGLGSEQKKRDVKARPMHEAQVMQLLEIYRAYKAPIPFKAGDIVTPRKTSILRYTGEPFIVLEVDEAAERDYSIANSGSPEYGARNNLRVMAIDGDGHALPWWAEHYSFEPFGLKSQGSS